MADFVSLGIHRPSALSYLIAESILPPNAGHNDYVWNVYPGHGLASEDELLYTSNCVVWSQDGRVRKVFNFDSSGQKVGHALLTRFRSNTTPPSSQPSGNSEHDSSHVLAANSSRWGSKTQRETKHSLATQSSDPFHGFDRALVIILKGEMHIHYLAGPTHVLNLPFDVERAYPAVDGFVLQRRSASDVKEPPTPTLPPAPPNSFFSTQPYLFSQSRSPEVRASRFRPSVLPPSPPPGFSLDALFRDLSKGPESSSNDDLPRFYSLANPLSDLAPVSHAVFTRQPRFPRPGSMNAPIVEYDTLDLAEELVYVSSNDEFADTAQNKDTPLILLVTVNRELGQITVWQAWYLDPPSLSTLLSQRAAQQTAKSKRPSSVITGRTAGAATPALRHRDRVRESFAASTRLSMDASMSRPSQDDEEVMASQMDPDYTLKKPGNPPRRVSSILSRDVGTADPSIRQTALGASFSGGGRRGPSLGSFHDRRSFGSQLYRKSRGSTPGSMFSRSFGPDDNSEFENSRMQDHMDDEYEAAQRLVEATHRSAGTESVLSSAPDGLRKELVVRRLDVFSTDAQNPTPASAGDAVKVFTLVQPSQSEKEGRTLSLYILDRLSKNMTTVKLRVRKRPQVDLASQDRYMPIPFLSDRNITSNVADVSKIRDGRAAAIAYMSTTTHELGIIPAQGITWALPLARQVRSSNPSDISQLLYGNSEPYQSPASMHSLEWPLELQHPGGQGKITLTAQDGQKNRLQIRLSPKNLAVRQILELCQLALPKREGGSVSALWCNIHYRFAAGDVCLTHGLDMEWEAMIVALFAFAAGSIGRTLRANHRARSLQPDRTTLDGHRPAIFSSQLRPRSLRSDLQDFASPAWGWLEKPSLTTKRVPATPRSKQRSARNAYKTKETTFSLVDYETMTRNLLHDIAIDELEWLISPDSAESRYLCCIKIMLVLHLFREEQKLNSFSDDAQGLMSNCLGAIIAQFGQWLGLEAWSPRIGCYLELDGSLDDWELSTSTLNASVETLLNLCPNPQSVFGWVEKSFIQGAFEPFLSISSITAVGIDETTVSFSRLEREILPRLSSLQILAGQFDAIRSSPRTLVEALKASQLTASTFETLPEGVLAPLREAINRCQSRPPTTWPPELLKFVAREDLVGLSQQDKSTERPGSRGGNNSITVPHDVHTIYSSADRAPITAKTHEAERHAIISLIFSEDRRFVDAARLMNPTAVQIAECPPQPEWSEVEYLEQQKKVMQWVMVRTFALSPGDAMVHFESQRPLLSERIHIKGFSTSCQMKPMDNTISADRSGFTEEKYSWAFFHAGVSAGLSISRNATGIDTSWIVFNKPPDLSNRHAGFLLALGINGHLRTLAKWLAFKYLTPKHNMTSIGLLLGLSASYLGTMDTLLTRMLSVHITRMLPPGAAELNVSPTTQTAGLMGIGLLYFNTQHRRMSEIMLSEIEHREIDDPGSTMDLLRDESYRLAAGFALGYINLGKGRDLRGLHGMNLLERLLTVAIGSRPVDLVHVVDKATAGAVMAIALIYMKTEDEAVARKIDIPDTIAQLEHVRPDVLLLRTVASHLIMWNGITDEPDWICRHLPKDFALRYYGNDPKNIFETVRLPQLRSKDVPFFNIITGLAWTLGLRWAGSGNHQARDQVLAVLKTFIKVSKQEAYYYDAKLARNTVKRCVDTLALTASTIMAGTGDLETFRYLRALHGRADPETTYGSHLAAHIAIGTLFLGGGTYTFGTSNFAVASLMCAFYPLFPSDVLDNRVHLQALRHFWVFAAEPRCIVVQDIDTKRPIHVKLKISIKDGVEKSMTAPCLLPELSTISRISTDDPTYWQMTLDFSANPEHLSTFKHSQTVYVRRCPAHEASSTVFSSALSALNDAQSSIGSRQMWEWILRLPAFQNFDQADFGLIIPADTYSATHLDEKLTVVDSRLTLMRSVEASGVDGLWNLRLLFSWAQNAVDNGDGRLRWIGRGVVDMLRASVAERMRRMGGVE